MALLSEPPPLSTPMFERDKKGHVIGYTLPWIMFFTRLAERADLVDDLSMLQAAATAPGAAAPTTPPSFSDDFNRSDTTGGIGDLWIGSGSNTSAAGAAAGVYVGYRIFNNALRTQHNGGAGNTTPGVSLMPRRTINGLWAIPQFAQATWVTGANAAQSAGPAVMITGDLFANAANGYYVDINATTVTIKIRRINGASTLVHDYGVNPANGDVILIEVTPGAASNDLEVFQNGVSLGVVNDAGGPILTGTAGFHIEIVDPANTHDWDDFSCGPL